MISELILTVFASVSLATKNNSMSASQNTPEKENAFSLVHDVATDGNTVLTGDDLRQYNIKHSQKSGSASGIDDAESYLKSCFGNDCFIVKDEANSDMLENSPESPNEFTTPYMATVRKNKNMSETNYMGCGRIGMFTLLDYLANYNGYNSLYDDYHEIESNRVNLMTYILNKTNAMDFFGQGTFSGPKAIKDSLNDYFLKRGYGNVFTIEGGVNGDKEWKIDFIKENIKNNIPLLVFTPNRFGYYKNHYMTITGYSSYTVDAGNKGVKTKTLLKVNMNWGPNTSPKWFDSDWFDGEFNCSVLAPRLKKIRVDFKPSDLPLVTAYSASEVKNPKMQNGVAYIIKHQRCHNYQNECAVLSAQKKDCGVSWLEFDCGSDFRCVQILASFWRKNDYTFLSSSTIQLQFTASDSLNWSCAYDFKENASVFSSDRSKMTCVTVSLPNGVKRIRLYRSATGIRVE